jgi:N-acetylglucosamine-6-phosphate deacetylase
MQMLEGFWGEEGPKTIYFDDRLKQILPLNTPPVHLIVPGFVDLHVHGGGGADCMEGEAAVRTMARFHASHGTVALLATTLTAPVKAIEAALEGIDAVIKNPRPGEARILGVHLEGPFINPNKLGAQPAYAINPDLKLMQRWMEIAPIKVVTLAAELPGALALIQWLTSQGVRVQQGHSLATYAQSRAALAQGAVGFTHLYNAMTGLNHREPGVVGAALGAQWAEVIVDGLHVHPAVLALTQKNLPGLYAITDAVAPAGMPDGTYILGDQAILKRSEGIFLGETGETLAGSALTMNTAFKNLRGWGWGLGEAIRATSTNALSYLGLPHELGVGSAADMAVLDQQNELQSVYIGGQKV